MPGKIAEQTWSGWWRCRVAEQIWSGWWRCRVAEQTWSGWWRCWVSCRGVAEEDDFTRTSTRTKWIYPNKYPNKHLFFEYFAKTAEQTTLFFEYMAENFTILEDWSDFQALIPIVSPNSNALDPRINLKLIKERKSMIILWVSQEQLWIWRTSLLMHSEKALTSTSELATIKGG